MLQTNDQIVGLCTTAIHSAAGMMRAYLDSIEKVHSTQSKALHSLLDGQAATARQLEVFGNLQELLAAQSSLAQEQMAQAMNLCTDLFAAGSLSQMECLRQAQSQALELIEGMGRTLEQKPVSGAESLVAAMQQVVEAARSSYTAGIKATEAAAQEAAARIDASKGDTGKSTTRIKRAA